MNGATSRITTIFLASAVAFGSLMASSSAKADDLKAKLASTIEEAKHWAAEPAIVDAVKAANAKPEHPDMSQDKWKSLSALDPVVRGLSKNAAASALKGKGDGKVSEAFVNAADGSKVALLSKTSGWNHKGKPKHDKPMKGEVWIGSVERDDSTGLEQVQFSVPVLDGGKPIGSLVVGVAVNKLK